MVQVTDFFKAKPVKVSSNWDTLRGQETNEVFRREKEKVGKEEKVMKGREVKLKMRVSFSRVN